jgi:hypothetical protein
LAEIQRGLVRVRLPHTRQPWPSHARSNLTIHTDLRDSCSAANGQGEEALAEEKAVKIKKPVEPLLPGRYGRMTARDLDEDVAKFDQEFIIETGKPLTLKERRTDQKAKSKRGRPRVGAGARRVLVSIEASLLRRLDDYAEKHGLTRSVLIARGLEVLLAKGADNERAK